VVSNSRTRKETRISGAVSTCCSGFPAEALDRSHAHRNVPVIQFKDADSEGFALGKRIDVVVRFGNGCEKLEAVKQHIPQGICALPQNLQDGN
jgi:hypothetical protein